MEEGSCEKTSVLETILSHLGNFETTFVFPSAVAAEFWTLAAAEECSARAVDNQRFLAWDDFVETTLAEDRRDRTRANGPTRELFSHAFLERNAVAAKKGTPLLQELVVPTYAQAYGPFARSIARALPGLEGLFVRDTEFAGDVYFQDLLVLRQEYRSFLDSHRLYEPSWERVPFHAGGRRWVLFFPELVQDWSEYRDELSKAPELELITHERLEAPRGFRSPRRKGAELGAADLFGGENPVLCGFPSADEELEWIIRCCKKLVTEAQVRPSDIAISVPELEKVALRLQREADIRDLPLTIRGGKPLARYPAGRFFSAVSALSSSRYSFRALSELLLDKAFPWKEGEAVERLLAFGRRFHCVAGFQENGLDVDVWESSFDRVARHAESHEGASLFPYASAARFYRALKRDVEAVRRARNFAELKHQLSMLKTNQLDESALDPLTDASFASCMDLLGKLSRLEEDLGDLVIPEPYSFFLSQLETEPYVQQSRADGVRVYDYRVAAGIAPVVHFVANMNQEAATVRYDPVSFLREDRKLRTPLEQRDASSLFVDHYALSGYSVAFSWCERSVSGYAIPHRALSRWTPQDTAIDIGGDPVEEELNLFLPSGNPSPKAAATHFQRHCLERLADTALSTRSWVQGAVGVDAPKDGRRVPLSDDPGLRTSIRAYRMDDIPKISPTDLKKYTGCPFQWFLMGPLALRNIEDEAGSVDARDIGTLYHRILERFFEKVRLKDPRFRASELPAYRELLAEETRGAIAERREEEGAFQEEVFAMLLPRLNSHLSALLERLAPSLDGIRIRAAEKNLRKDYPDLGLALTGIADLVYERDENLGILDYKTGSTPGVSELRVDQEGILADHQMASYIRLLETGNATVTEARFVSIEERKDRSVLSPVEKTGRTGLPLSRDQYEDSVRAMEKMLERVSLSFEELLFPVPPEGRRLACGSCEVFAVCRIPYSGEGR